MELFTEISLTILLVTGVAFILKLLKQPFILGYVIAGIIVGPYGFRLLHAQDSLEFFSKIGIAILLFIVGLNLNLKVIKEVGKVAFLAGLGQVVFTAIAGYAICMFLGLATLPALYVSIALTFSSTIIVLKLLTDTQGIDTLYGKISTGILLVQDLVASIVLVVISSLATSTNMEAGAALGLLVAKALGIGLGVILLSKFVLRRIVKFSASSQELLFLFSISWGLVMASVFYALGFSTEIGALVAGVTLSTTPFASEIASRMKPLRDFFVMMFFVFLGSGISLGSLFTVIGPALILSLFVLVCKPLIVILLMNFLGHRRKVAFMTGVTMAQISEFSLMLMSIGLSLGHVSADLVAFVTLIGLITIAGSSSMILHGHSVYRSMEQLLKLLEFGRRKQTVPGTIEGSADIILFGYDRAGVELVPAISKMGRSFLVVDYNPESIERLKENKIPSAYGDAGDSEFLDEIGLKHAKLVISTIPDLAVNKLLVRKLKHFKSQAISILVSHRIADSLELYELGASYVIMPLYLGAQYAVDMIGKYGVDTRAFSHEKEKHMKHLLRKMSS